MCVCAGKTRWKQDTITKPLLLLLLLLLLLRHHLTDLGPEAGHLVLQLPHPVRLGDGGRQVVLGGDLLVL